MSEDIIAGAPLLMGYGRGRLCIENYRNIIEYTDSLIRIQTKTGRIHIIGRNLVIAYFRDDGMCVVGEIGTIEYHKPNYIYNPNFAHQKLLSGHILLIMT